jgi:hypothetical protein
MISEYISHECQTNHFVPFNKFVKGLTEEDIYASDNQLDMYYLNYEKTHNCFNFIYT